MKRVKKIWLLALALSLLLTCAACGKQKVPAADTTLDTKQEQTADTKQDGAAKADTTKTDDKQAETKTEDKTGGDKKSEEEKTAEDEAKKAEEEAKKLEEQKKLEEEQKKQEEQPKQDEPAKQPEQPKQEIDPATGKDKYQTDPVPEGKPVPVEPGTSSTGGSATCTFSISCATILNNWDKCDESKKPLVPADGVILPTTTVTFTEGESVFDVLQRLCRENKIHMESSWTPMYNSAYVEGINNLYEFDVGSLSGWMYSVNGWFPNYGCSRYALQNGDVVEWRYTCDLGYDLGSGMGG